MSTPNELDEAFVALPDLALGIVPAPDAVRLMTIVRTSDKLQAELASLRAATDALASAVPAAAMAADRRSAMRARLLERASDDRSPTRTEEVYVGSPAGSASAPVLTLVTPESRPIVGEVFVPARLTLVQRIAPLFAAAASVMFVLSVLRLQDALQARNDAQAALQTMTQSTTQLEQQLAARDSLVAAMSGAKVTVVELASTSNLPPGAKMFWDRVANRWTLVTHDLKPVQPGRTYQLWLVTAKAEKISAGTFNTDANGRAVVQATYALAERELAAIAITEEPTGGSPQPTGAILVAGAPTR
ncbi:MAG: anti-sigma factor [Gemmatimonadaceae bacterium]|nr:anti-sigma factor [Gemmatimonadaceae bacterium]